MLRRSHLTHGRVRAIGLSLRLRHKLICDAKILSRLERKAVCDLTSGMDSMPLTSSAVGQTTANFVTFSQLVQPVRSEIARILNVKYVLWW